MTQGRTSLIASMLAFLVPSAAIAQSTTVSSTAAIEHPEQPKQPAVTEPDADGPKLELTWIGYVETSYTWAFGRPSNGIINFRGFDNRHNTWTIENVAFGAAWAFGDSSGKILLQIGATPSTYYLAEPSFAGASAANATGPEIWKYLQEAYLGYRAPLGRGLLLQAGICASPIGTEVIPIKDNWNWSRSNLFFGLPFYHTGIRATYEIDDRLSATLAVYNGWNSVVDNNGAKSIAANLTYAIPDFLLVQLLYFGGNERPRRSPEGAPWRHDVDASARIDLTSWLSLMAQVNGGGESTNFGTAWWIAGALYGRFRIADFLFLALRGDLFRERIPSNELGAASPIFWAGAGWVASATATLEARLSDHLSVRLEYRHDQAEQPLYFDRNATGDPNAKRQDTLSLGITGWI